MKASDLFLRCLEAEGVEYIFGVPGEENADVLISLRDSTIRFIPTHHEQGAAFMADVYGRLKGRPASACRRSARARRTSSPASRTRTWTTRRWWRSRARARRPGCTRSRTRRWTSSPCSTRSPSGRRRSATSAPSPRSSGRRSSSPQAEKPGATHVELPEDIAKHEVHESADPAAGAGAAADPGHEEHRGRARPDRPGRASGAARRPRLRPHPGQQAALPLRRRDRHLLGQHVHGQGRARRPQPAQPLRRRSRLPGLRHRGVRVRRPRHRRRLRHGRVAPGAVEHRPAQARSCTSTSSPPRSTAPTSRTSRWSATSPPRCGR